MSPVVWEPIPAKVKGTIPRLLGDAEPCGGVVGLIFKTPMKEGVHVNNPNEVSTDYPFLKCPSFPLVVRTSLNSGMQSSISGAQGGQRPCHEESPALWILTSFCVFLELIEHPFFFSFFILFKCMHIVTATGRLAPLLRC